MDWITARRKCSIEHAWNTLCERIGADIEIWRAPPGGNSATIEFSADADVAVITKNSPQTSTSKVTLRRKSHHIAVELPGSQHSITLTPHTSEAGECKLREGNADLEFWQASRRILEKFLFADGEA
jgi:hypothetical protein